MTYPIYAQGDRYYASIHDLQREPIFEAREADWRNGALIYQVIVDRFGPPTEEELAAKRDLYPAPKRLLSWDQPPTRGTYNRDVEVWSHEIDFWGGDLNTLSRHLDYVHELGVDVLYLNPIHQAYTNHKYDAQDYKEVSAEYGTRQDVFDLAADVHERDMKLVLDGVFNHMGRTSPYFQEAMTDPQSPYRDWFYVGDDYRMGYRGWVNVANLPELNLENPLVQDYVFATSDSVVQGYLRGGVDGWRLDVAFDIGPAILDDLTRAAHTARPGSVVIGEIWNYPEEWIPAVDGVMNMHLRQILLELVQGHVSGPRAGRMVQTMIDDTGLEGILKSWLILDNHDTQRLKTALPETWQQRMAQTLQMTLPGAPCIYYGVEVGMTGGDDPEQRGPMRWDLVSDDNEDYVFARQLLDLRARTNPRSRSLRVGDFRLLDSDKLLAFMRRTDRVAETCIVIANPTNKRVTEFLQIRESKLLGSLVDVFTGKEIGQMANTVRVTIPAQTTYVLFPKIDEGIEYSPYMRVR